MSDRNGGQNGADLAHTGSLLRHARPQLSALGLDQIKRDVLGRGPVRRRRGPVSTLQRRLLAVSLSVMLFAISTSSAAAQVLNLISGGTLAKTLGVTGKTSGTQFFFGSVQFGGDKSDDAGHSTYCKDDGKGSDDGGSSDGNSDRGGKGSDDNGGKGGSYGSKSASATTIKTITTTTRSGASQGGDNSSEGNKGPCDTTNGSDSDGKDGKGSDDNGGKYDNGGKGGYDNKSGGKDTKSSGKDDGKSSSSKDSKSTGKK